jgi:CDP-diacylglycerol---serine O-phosphatidyltransferase
MSKDNVVIRNIPNLFTSLNLLAGAIAIILSFEGRNNLSLAAYFIYIAAVFDFFDGFAARALKATSRIGKELDSLADLVSFGVAPSMIVYQLIKHNLQLKQFSFSLESYKILMLFSALLIAVFSAIRLAKFNVDERQKENFLGLATPACAMLIASIPLISDFNPNSLVLFPALSKNIYFFLGLLFFEAFIVRPVFLIPLVILLSILLVSRFPMFSMKFKSASFEENKLKFIFLICSIMLFATLQIVSVPLIFILYLAFSFFNFMLERRLAKRTHLDRLFTPENAQV